MGTIYFLINPLDESIFYIGITKLRLGYRLSQHLTEARRGNRHPKCDIIRNILRNKLRPIIEEYKSGASYKEEFAKINRIAYEGKSLCNIVGNYNFKMPYNGIGDRGFHKQLKNGVK